MKRNFKKFRTAIIAAGIIFTTVLVSSCETEDVSADTTEQSIEETTKIQNNDVSKDDCDCDVLLNLDLDLNDNGIVSASDLLYLQRILNELDFDNDGCVQGPSRVLGAGDAGIWSNSGGTLVPNSFYDYNHDGTIDSMDVFYAFVYVAPRFGNISGGDGILCKEDIDCMLAYIVGNLIC